MSKKFTITIGRQLGSGGREIGRTMATRLGISYYDKELLQIASRESGLGKEFFEDMDEKKSHSIFGGVFDVRNMVTEGHFSGAYLSNETLFKIQSDVIRNLAEKESGLFLGRCADYVLKDFPQCLNIFVSADLNDRIKRVAELQQVTEGKARDLIEKTDRKRAGYYRFFSNKIWGAAESYHLCINSSVLGIHDTAEFLIWFTEKRFGL